VLRLSKEIAIKANLEDVSQQLNEKANKKTVASALQRKMNRSDVDALLGMPISITNNYAICKIYFLVQLGKQKPKTFKTCC